MEKLNLTQEWDKVFPKSDKVDHKKVTFHNRYGITLAADMYTPRGTEGKLPAIAVSGPFGAVKEQSSGLYAQKMAELGFLTIAFDPSYTGESGGTPRYVASPDINTEDFCAAVDFLSVQENVDPERIGIIGMSQISGTERHLISFFRRLMRYKVNVIATEYALNLKVPAYHMGTIIDEICARKGWERPWFVSESSERHCVSNAVASTSFGTPNDNLLGENP